MNTQPRQPKCRALPVEPHPDIHFSAMIPRRTVKIKFFLSVVIPVVKAAFVPPSVTGESPANAGVARLCGVSPHPIPDTTTALPNLCLNFQRGGLRTLWHFPVLLRFLFGTLLACLFQAPLSAFGICVGLNSVY